MKLKSFVLTLTLFISSHTLAGDSHLSGKIISLMGHGQNPAIRLTNAETPNLCDGGNWGWIYFAGTAQEKQWIYSTAMAMALTGNTVTVYTNSDGAICRITNIQITSGLN